MWKRSWRKQTSGVLASVAGGILRAGFEEIHKAYSVSSGVRPRYIIRGELAT